MPLIKLLVEGGNMKPGPAVAQQLGPMGINMGKVISDVNSATSEFKGINVPVHLNVDSKTKEFTIKVLSPPTSELIKKELGIETASGERKKLIVGNLAFEQVIGITKAKHDSMLSKDFLGTLKSVIGTCMALGVIIDNKEVKDILEDINKGVYKKQIDEKISEVPIEKKKELDAYFKEISEGQKAAIKKEEEEKAAEEEKKEEAAGTAPVKKEEENKVEKK